MSFKVLIVEDEPMVAEDIAGHLQQLNYEVASIQHSAEEAMDFLSKNEVDCAVIDITLAGDLTGLDLAAHLNEEIHIPFIFLTSHADRITLERVKECQAGGYIVKPFDENDLYTSLELAISNFSHRAKKKSTMTLESLNAKLEFALSVREFEVLEAMQGGKTNTELADSLFLSVNTVKTHLKHIYEKLGVKNRTEAIFKIQDLMKS